MEQIIGEPLWRLAELVRISLGAAADNLAARLRHVRNGAWPATQKPRHSWEWRGFCVLERNGALDRIRTYGLLLRRQTLYPLSYEGIRGFRLFPER